MKQSSNLAFLLSCMLLACTGTVQQSNPAPAENLQHACIQDIIAADNSLGDVRNNACKSISMAQTIRNYADSLQQLDYTNCPPAFTSAFENHRQAWLAMVPLVENYPDMRGEMHDLFDQLEEGPHADTFKVLLKNIWDTWGVVEASMGNQPEN